MEHRRSARRPLREHVTIESARIGHALVSLRDISLAGMFVEPSPIYLRLKETVSTSFSLPRAGTRYSFRLQAKVVRQTPIGAGLSFLPMDSAVIHALSEALTPFILFGGKTILVP